MENFQQCCKTQLFFQSAWVLMRNSKAEAAFYILCAKLKQRNGIRSPKEHYTSYLTLISENLHFTNIQWPFNGTVSCCFCVSKAWSLLPSSWGIAQQRPQWLPIWNQFHSLTDTRLPKRRPSDKPCRKRASLKPPGMCIPFSVILVSFTNLILQLKLFFFLNGFRPYAWVQYTPGEPILPNNPNRVMIYSPTKSSY
ncbi:hypothetical protein Lalb_Chr02g0154671 [Lupinus albus]|uniref:Uncharacterized protein n=1 Tax=Lupinus albus TaxID=3870 RepID=A0A6A4R1H5_LUPAL|nr:hypothetical protein Lalb_Chr02g0154671 [Lupinus albus]